MTNSFIDDLIAANTNGLVNALQSQSSFTSGLIAATQSTNWLAEMHAGVSESLTRGLLQGYTVPPYRSPLQGVAILPLHELAGESIIAGVSAVRADALQCLASPLPNVSVPNWWDNIAK